MSDTGVLLTDESPLQVLPSLAAKIGLNQAIMLQQIHYWQQKKANFEDGRYWVYNSFEEWQGQFPFWSVSTIKRLFYDLKKKKLIVMEKRRAKNFDHRNWVSIEYEAVESLDIGLTPEADDRAAISEQPDMPKSNGRVGTNEQSVVPGVNIRLVQNDTTEEVMLPTVDCVKMNQCHTETTSNRQQQKDQTETPPPPPAGGTPDGVAARGDPPTGEPDDRPPKKTNTKNELFEYVLEAVYGIKYRRGQKLSKAVRGRVNGITGALKDVEATPTECASALKWHTAGRDDKRKKLSKPGGASSWAKMIVDYRGSDVNTRENSAEASEARRNRFLTGKYADIIQH